MLEYFQICLNVYKEMNSTRKGVYVQGNEYVHRRVGTYTVREAHDQLRNSRKKLVQFYLQIESIMEKGV